MTPLQQTIVVWLAVSVVTPVVLYVCRAGKRRQTLERRIKRVRELERRMREESRRADAYHRAVLARHPSVSSLTEDDAMRLRIQLDQLPTAEEPEVRG